MSRSWIQSGMLEVESAGAGGDHDTATFAAETLRRWWRCMGRAAHPDARRLLVTADAGGSNGHRNRLWKLELQRFADETGLTVSVCHFPPRTRITENWRGHPLVSREAVVGLTPTRPPGGLSIEAEMDASRYPTGVKVSDAELAGVRNRPACPAPSLDSSDFVPYFVL